ncbi:MAG: hypothetical protein ABIJ39_02420 [Chloroflexota bacterium]
MLKWRFGKGEAKDGSPHVSDVDDRIAIPFAMPWLDESPQANKQ